MPDVEQKIQPPRAAVFMSETDDLYLEWRAFLGTAEFLHDKMAQRMDVVLGRIDYQIGEFAVRL